MAHKLKTGISKKALFFITINAIIGTGIFFLPAVGAASAGPASIISWLIMALVSIFVAFYFAELVSMFPKSGGVYEYTKNAFGEFPSFIFGWTAWIVANITISMLIIGSLIYVFPGHGALFNMVFALGFIVLFNFVSYRGIDISAKLLLFFGVMTIFAMLMIIVPGIFFINTANLTPFFVFPISSIMLTTYLIAETFFGWETAGYLSEEVRDPRKTIPRMIIITTATISLISIALVFVALSSVQWNVFAVQDAPLSFLIQRFLGVGFAGLFSLIVFIPLIGTAASWIVSSPRLLYAMSRDGVLVPSFSHIHSKHMTPHKAILFQTVVSSFITIVAMGDFMLILSLLVPLAVIMYSGVMLSVVKLRIKKPEIKRYFNAPFPRAGPILVTAFFAFLLYTWLTQVAGAIYILLLGLILIFIGAPLYILIKLQTDEKFTAHFFDSISVVWDRLFPLWYGKKDIEIVVNRLKINERSTILDFGCGSGITTEAIARKARRGVVLGVDISEKQLDHAIKRLKKKNLNNVIFVKEPSMRFKKNSFDAIAGVGVLEYLDKPKPTVAKMFTFLKKGGRFSFLSFGKSMGTPAPYHLSSENEIRKIFPCKVNIRREKKKMTEYWHIWGVKK
jgi:basic amino acid/polyamine antiporter, APA family